jgi:hypothetical protein
MSIGTSALTTLKITASAPATFDASGYNALSMTTIGEITNFGEIGREFNLVTHNPVSSRGTQKFKGSYNEGTMQLQMALDTDDAGQILMKAAALSDNKYSFTLTTPNGDKYYFQGLVMNFKVGVNDVDSMTAATATIEITTSSTGVGIVEVLAS